MPAIAPGSQVLVTGASGFIATNIVQTFLDNGFPVRGAVRSKEKGEYLSELFKDAKAKFTYVVVPDMSVETAYDEAVKGVVGVAHTASPFHFAAEDPDELIGPAVAGTQNILKSIEKNGAGVQRVVVTSSVATIKTPDAPRPTRYDEKDWNMTSTARVQELGNKSSGSDKYQASKTLAELAFWKWIEDKKPSWDGATVHPPLTIGPIRQPLPDLSALNTSCTTLMDWYRGKYSDIPHFSPYNFVDARDVALAHVRSLTVPAAGGQRFITSAGPAGPNDYVLAFEKLYPGKGNYVKGDKEHQAAWLADSDVFDGSKAEKLLGIKYITLEQSIKDTMDSLLARFTIQNYTE